MSILIASFTSDVNWDYYGDVSGTERRNAQSFTMSEAYTITEAHIKLGAQTGSPDVLTLRIETASGNVPSGTLAHANATKTQAGTINDWNVFTFATPFTLAAGTYHIVGQCQDQANDNYYNWLADEGSYAGGQRSYSNDSGASWIESAGYDMTFKVYGELPTTGYNSQIIMMGE